MVRLKIAAIVLCLTGCSTHDAVSPEGSRSRSNATAPGSLHEQSILDAINRLRTDPGTFALMIDSRRAYFQGKILHLPAHAAVQTREGVSAVVEAVDSLANSEPVPALQLAPALRQAAREHGSELGKRGLISHEGADGSSPRDRILRYCGVEGETGELISFGLGRAGGNRCRTRGGRRGRIAGASQHPDGSGLSFRRRGLRAA